jgi:DNA-binding response OmpR family regulator
MNRDSKNSSPQPTLLVVDDNETVLELLDLLLSHHGSTVVKATSGSQCLDIVRRQPVDVVILDVMMPGMDGIQVAAELKRMLPSLPIILLTARDDLATRAAAMALGVNEFVSKPINNRDLLDRVRTHIASRRWQLEMERTTANVARLSEAHAGKIDGRPAQLVK